MKLHVIFVLPLKRIWPSYINSIEFLLQAFGEKNDFMDNFHTKYIFHLKENNRKERVDSVDTCMTTYHNLFVQKFNPNEQLIKIVPEDEDCRNSQPVRGNISIYFWALI